MNPWRSFAAGVRKHVEGRDLLGAAGLALLAYGGEQLLPGAGLAVSGLIMVAIAVLVR